MVQITIIGKFPEKFLGGCGYIYCKHADLYKNILTLHTWRNGLRSVELVCDPEGTYCKFGVAKDLH